jgi:hypothetical protein
MHSQYQLVPKVDRVELTKKDKPDDQAKLAEIF